jgi:hypothetical protein
VPHYPAFRPDESVDRAKVRLTEFPFLAPLPRWRNTPAAASPVSPKYSADYRRVKGFPCSATEGWARGGTRPSASEPGSAHAGLRARRHRQLLVCAGEAMAARATARHGLPHVLVSRSARPVDRRPAARFVSGVTAAPHDHQ